jgi:uncharacterized membrane protein YfcA
MTSTRENDMTKRAFNQMCLGGVIGAPLGGLFAAITLSDPIGIYVGLSLAFVNAAFYILTRE